MKLSRSTQAYSTEVAPGPLANPGRAILSSWSLCNSQADKVRSQVIRMVGESQEAVGAAAGGGSGPGSNKLPTLEEYGTNLTTQAVEVRD